MLISALVRVTHCSRHPAWTGGYEANGLNKQAFNVKTQGKSWWNWTEANGVDHARAFTSEREITHCLYWSFSPVFYSVLCTAVCFCTTELSAAINGYRSRSIYALNSVLCGIVVLLDPRFVSPAGRWCWCPRCCFRLGHCGPTPAGE